MEEQKHPMSTAPRDGRYILIGPDECDNDLKMRWETKRNTTGTEFTVETHKLPKGTWYAVRFKDQKLPCGWAGTVNEAYADLLHWQRARMR